MKAFGLPDWAIACIQHGDDIEELNAINLRNGWRTDKDPYPSRSEPLLAAVGAMHRHNVPEKIIAAVLIDPQFGISASVLANKKPKEYAVKQILKVRSDQPDPASQPSWVEITEKGIPKPTYSNARAAIAAMGVTAEKNTFTDRLRLGGHPLGEFAGDLTDDVTTMLRQAIIDRYRLDCGTKNVQDAAKQLCLENSFDPVKDYFDQAGEEWDGIERLANWLTTYLGAPDTPLNRAIGKSMLTAAVARVMDPGCKFDHVAVLEGPQGTGKSSALRILAGDEYFSDAPIIGRREQEQQEALQGVLICELGELAGLSKSDADTVKALVSRQSDRARPAYGHFVIDRLRRCIFVGTTNASEYLLDPTGNRRFWPVATTTIDLAGLARVRDQLWGEARRQYVFRMNLDIPQELIPDAMSIQSERMITDPWIDRLEPIKGERYGDQMRVSTEFVLGAPLLKIEPKDQTPAMLRRVGSLMRVLGWTGPAKMRIDGRSIRGYWRHATPEEVATLQDVAARNGPSEVQF